MANYLLKMAREPRDSRFIPTPSASCLKATSAIENILIHPCMGYSGQFITLRRPTLVSRTPKIAHPLPDPLHSFAILDLLIMSPFSQVDLTVVSYIQTRWTSSWAVPADLRCPIVAYACM